MYRIDKNPTNISSDRNDRMKITLGRNIYEHQIFKENIILSVL